MDTRAEMEIKAKRIVASQLGVAESIIVGNSKFVDDLGADSLDLVELIMAIEEEFDIDIPDDDAENIRTVDDATNYIMKAQSA